MIGAMAVEQDEDTLYQRGWESFAPPEKISAVEWLERELTLSERSTGYPGPMRIRARTPYLVEPVNAISDPTCEEITMCTGAQVGKTTFQLGSIAYAIDQDPGPGLLVIANNDLCRSVSEQRLHPLIEDAPILARHLPADKKKFRLQEMMFDRMQLALVGANSPANLSSRPVRWLWLDEIDKYPGVNERESGAVHLAMVRTRTFGNRKIFKTSTPTLTSGPIWQSFLDGDQRFYWVPCPKCDTYQVLVFSRKHSRLTGIYDWSHVGEVKWPASCRREDGTWDRAKVAKAAYYQCGACGHAIQSKDKRKMIQRGEWRPERPGNGRHRSYQLSALYAPWPTTSFGNLAVEFLEAQGDLDQMVHFINSTLGEPRADAAEMLTVEHVLSHRSTYRSGTCPIEPLAIIITADVQKDCCYYVVRAWGEGDQSYLIRYGIVPSLDQLRHIANSSYPCGDTAVMPTYAFVDSGAFTKEVYMFCKMNNWIPLKGFESRTQPVLFSDVGDVHLMTLDTTFFKEALHMRMRIPLGEIGSWSLPAECGVDYGQQIANEGVQEEKDKLGRVKRKWVVFGANHYLDCEVYQLAAAQVLGLREMVRDMPGKKQADVAKRESESNKGGVRFDGRGWWDR